VAEESGRALVEFKPITGRTHQLRVHSASGIGIPLLGDPVYGDGKGVWRTMLHAVEIEVARDGKPAINATAPWPLEFAGLGFSDG
jgi:tRNA pseudouridine32 synthase/23S rRNA pseudouridine746 synthase